MELDRQIVPYSFEMEIFTRFKNKSLLNIIPDWFIRIFFYFRLSDLLSSDNHEAYAKLIISSLDYSKPGPGRALLQKCLISNKIVRKTKKTD